MNAGAITNGELIFLYVPSYNFRATTPNDKYLNVYWSVSSISLFIIASIPENTICDAVGFFASPLVFEKFPLSAQMLSQSSEKLQFTL